MKITSILLFLLVMVSCAHHPPLTTDGQKVTLMQPQKGKCKFIKSVWKHLGFGKKNPLNLENHFKNEVAEIGGNVGHVTKIQTFGPYIEGEAYFCPENYITKYKKSLYKK